MDNLEGVYQAPLKSLVVSKPNSGSTIGGQVNVDYLQFANIFVFRILKFKKNVKDDFIDAAQTWAATWLRGKYVTPWLTER